MSIKRIITASVESISQNDLYMTLKARLFTIPDANLNGCRCTEAFLDEIVSNQDKYVGLPLSVDVHNLINGNYDKLGHMYNKDTNTYGTSMVGSFSSFQKEDLGNGKYALVGYCRVMKRYKKVCSAIAQLFADNNLKFSFEVNVGKYEQLDDGTIVIDADQSNSWQGECIVWSPACPDATALQLVAEIINLGDSIVSQKGDDDKMDEKKEINTAEQVIAEQTNENAQTVKENAEQENAAVYHRTTVVEVVDDHACDLESGTCVSERLEHVVTVEAVDENGSLSLETPSQNPAPAAEMGEEENASCKKESSECEPEEKKDEECASCKKEDASEEDAACKKKADEETASCKKEDTSEENASCKKEDAEEETAACKKQDAEEESASCKKENSEQENASYKKEDAEEETASCKKEAEENASCKKETASTEELMKQIAELVRSVDSLKAEVSELKEKKVVAEVTNPGNANNPFVSSISIPVKKYSLLEKEDRVSGSLFEKI